MKHVQTECEISATPDRVWDVLTDFKTYGEWNPIIPSIKGGMQRGDHVAFRITLQGLPALRLRARVLRSERAREFAWGDGVRAIFYAEHYFRLEAIGTAKTRLVHGETFVGLIPLLMGPVIGSIQRSYEALNRALAARAERA